MKSALLFVVVIFSMNLFGQGNAPTYPLQHGSRSAKENVRMSFHEDIRNSSAQLPHRMPKNGMHSLLQEQLSPIQLVDSTYAWKWDTVTAGWVYDYKTIDMFYNAQNNPTNVTYQYWNGTTFENSVTYSYTYGVNNKVHEELTREWNGTTWVNYLLATSSYYPDNNLKDITFQVWNNNAWENDSKTMYTYDPHDNPIIELTQNWDVGFWENYAQNINTYDANDNRINLLQQIWNGSAWDNYWQFMTTYDTNDNLINELTQIWDGNSWDNYQLYSVFYDNNLYATNDLTQIWDGSQWLNFMQSTFTYDGVYNEIGFLSEFWIGSGWVKSVKYTYEYDKNNFVLNTTGSYYDNTGTSIIDRDSIVYYFRTITAIQNNKTENDRIVVFPNPARDQFSINSSIAVQAIEMYSLDGEKVFSDFFPTTHLLQEIDVSGLANGIYFIRIRSGTKIYYSKMVIQ